MDELAKLMNERDQHLWFAMRANDLLLDIKGMGLLNEHPDLLNRVDDLLSVKFGQVQKP